MIFTDEEIYYLNSLLKKHSIDLIDIIMNEEDHRDIARDILSINRSCLEKLISL